MNLLCDVEKSSVARNRLPMSHKPEVIENGYGSPEQFGNPTAIRRRIDVDNTGGPEISCNRDQIVE
jgi:hypothetical protein